MVGHAASFDMNTTNCTDALRPQNPWGTGDFSGPSRSRRPAEDPQLVALGVQEGWGSCGSVRNIAARLQWRVVSPEARWRRHDRATRHHRRAVGPVANRVPERRGRRARIAGSWAATIPDRSRLHQDRLHVDDAPVREHRRRVAAARGASARLARRQATADLFMGDLNIWRTDQWSPATNCGNPTPAMATALSAIVSSGYRDAWAATQQGEGWTAILVASRMRPRAQRRRLQANRLHLVEGTARGVDHAHRPGRAWSSRAVESLRRQGGLRRAVAFSNQPLRTRRR